MSPISFISTPPVIGLPSYLFKSILLEIQFLYNIWRYPYSWPGSSIFIFAVLLGFHCYKSVFPSISVWQDGSSIGRIDLPLSQKVVESTLGRMAPKKAWQDIAVLATRHSSLEVLQQMQYLYNHCYGNWYYWSPTGEHALHLYPEKYDPKPLERRFLVCRRESNCTGFVVGVEESAGACTCAGG